MYIYIYVSVCIKLFIRTFSFIRCKNNYSLGFRIEVLFVYFICRSALVCVVHFIFENFENCDWRRWFYKKIWKDTEKVEHLKVELTHPSAVGYFKTYMVKHPCLELLPYMEASTSNSLSWLICFTIYGNISIYGNT